jgi:3-phenylpropionate/trans-cinnamate dioxygenase ferredoxin subunit
LEAARCYYESPEYAPPLKLRQEAARSDIVLVEGWTPPPPLERHGARATRRLRRRSRLPPGEETRNGERDHTVRKNGPYLVSGAVEVRDADGNRYPKDATVALCRCGASTKKPFCGGTHSKVGFQAAERAVPGSAEG